MRPWGALLGPLSFGVLIYERRYMNPTSRGWSGWQTRNEPAGASLGAPSRHFVDGQVNWRAIHHTTGMPMSGFQIFFFLRGLTMKRTKNVAVGVCWYEGGGGDTWREMTKNSQQTKDPPGVGSERFMLPSLALGQLLPVPTACRMTASACSPRSYKQIMGASD